VDEADPEGNLRPEPLSGEEVPARGCAADPPENEGRNHRGDDPEAYFREAKGCVLGRDGNIGARDEAGAPAEGVALDARDHRHWAGIHGLEHSVQAHGVIDVLFEREVDGRALPVHIGAGAEARALAGEDDGACVGDVRECVRQLRDQGGVEGVPPFGPRQRDPQDRSVTLDLERAHRTQLKVRKVIRGALAAAVTPLRDDGERLDEEAFGPYVDFLAENRLDGIFALGTTGEGLLLSLDERKRAAELFVEAARGKLPVIVHCGAQNTSDTVELCVHAAGLGAGGVAVVAPPYYQFDAEGLAFHFISAAEACAPAPFYLYEFAARSGYAIPLVTIELLRQDAPNFAGMKVSDSPFDQVEPYLLDGLDVFVGSEPLLPQALGRGAAGTVSGLAAAFPDVIADFVADPTPAKAEQVAALRDSLQRIAFIAALKVVLTRRNVPIRADMRSPLRPLFSDEVSEIGDLAEWLESS
jgi:dihydrodipicolinate synthase/N-acetylneuraminate lyase